MLREHNVQLWCSEICLYKVMKISYQRSFNPKIGWLHPSNLPYLKLVGLLPGISCNVLSSLFVRCIYPLAFLFGLFPPFFRLYLLFTNPLCLRVWPIHLVLIFSLLFHNVRSSSILLYTSPFLILSVEIVMFQIIRWMHFLCMIISVLEGRLMHHFHETNSFGPV
jgi:hypothetical protein